MFLTFRGNISQIFVVQVSKRYQSIYLAFNNIGISNGIFYFFYVAGNLGGISETIINEPQKEKISIVVG